MDFVKWKFKILQQIRINNFVTRRLQMFVLNFVKSVCSKILEKLRLKRKSTKKIMILGLDNAGKTTLLFMLRDQVRRYDYIGNARYYDETDIDFGDLSLRLRDDGDRFLYRGTWKNYIDWVEGIIFMIDASDPSRFEQSKQQLNAVLGLQVFSDIPILILGNKIDKLSAVAESYLRQYMGLSMKGTVDWSSNPKARPIQIFMCTIARRMGYNEGLKWLTTLLTNRRKQF